MLTYIADNLENTHSWIADQSTVEFCEENIYLNSDASPITGMVSFEDTPHLEEVLNDRDRDEVWQQLLNFSTQTGKTFVMQCAWVKAMVTDPTRMQWTIKNKDDIKNYLDEKITPFMKGVKGLSDKVQMHNEDVKKKGRAETINIAGGGVAFTGTTEADKRSRSVKYLFCDEIALYEKGAFVELIGRTKSFERYYRKVLAVSSRHHKNDEMDANFKTCNTIKEWSTWCSSCNSYFYAGSKHFKYLKKEDYIKDNNITADEFDFQEYKREMLNSSIHIECPSCKHKITNEEKDKNILNKKYKS